MRVAIETRALALPGGGVRRYVEHLTEALKRGSEDHEYVCVGSERKPGVALDWWLNVTLPQQISEQQPDVVHFTKAAVPRRKRWPTVVTIYDVIPILFPQSQKIGRAHYWKKSLRNAVRNSDLVITISQASKQDIVSLLGADEGAVEVIPLAVDTAAFKPAQGEAQEKYVLFVGTREPRKNIGGLLRGFAKASTQMPHHLVIAGRRHTNPREERALASELGISDRVEWREFVPTPELPSLYANASLLVLPSVYEGWGFPAQEAMASGVPVIVSDGGSLPEVVGDAGIVVPFTTSDLVKRLADSDFESRLAEQMVSVVNDEKLQEGLATKGLERVASASWDRVAEKTKAVYEKLL